MGSTFEATFPEDVTFNGNTTCVNVSIVNDSALEGNHSFTMELYMVSTDPPVTTGTIMIGIPSSAQVIIFDDESM